MLNNNNNKETTMPKPKCITCNKNIKRKSHTYRYMKEPYSGNMICYRVKKNRVGEWDWNSPLENYTDAHGNVKDRPTIFIPKVPEQYTYNYTLWDGVSYYYYLGRYRFCGVNCAARYGIKHLPKKERGGL